MTDIEMTRACAEAMGYPVSAQPMTTPDNPGSAIAAHIKDGSVPTYYAPLHDDEQAMALVKRFDFVVERENDDTFGVTLFVPRDNGGRPAFNTHVVRNEPDLNRAIVSCVAQMHLSRTGKG